MQLVMKRIWTIAKIVILILVCCLVIARDNLAPADQLERVRAYTRNIEFDFVNWTLQALLTKNQAAVLSLQNYIPEQSHEEIITEYFRRVGEINGLKTQIVFIYSDPNIANPDESAAEFNQTLNAKETEITPYAILSETILQQRISTIIADLNLSAGGQLIPPLMYHVTPLPMALIVSPRNAIQQDADISLLPELTLEEIIKLEDTVERELNVSVLVVNIGGVGIYPTMVLRTTDFSWTIETIAHEWIHNFLTLRPLGMLYAETPQLRTMNETSASLAGKEIALGVYAQYYPQFLPKPVIVQENTTEEPTKPAQPPAFDYRAEMHATRLKVDALLADGKIEQAEEYMEQRRIYFWDNGYHIRKINQAFFAFYGAYADVPGGAAGTDPVGPAVVSLREQSSSLAAFLNRISWMTSFEDLLNALQ